MRSAIPHPRIMGVIKECGGKMWMGERIGYPPFFLNCIAERYMKGQWNRASEDFFESFRNYDEAGSPQRIQVLKYLVLANMLTGSEVNPFDSQETKPWVTTIYWRKLIPHIGTSDIKMTLRSRRWLILLTHISAEKSTLLRRSLKVSPGFWPFTFVSHSC